MITPEYISSLIRFNASKSNEDWKYDAAEKDMFNLQAQGSSRIYNILEEHKVALLADEVGMGKTIQALSVCVALWTENPNARILILVPRDEIASNWEREYQTFIRHHYRHHDDVIKTQSGHIPIKKLIRSSNLFELVNEIKNGWAQLYVGKISSFSNLMSKQDVVERIEKLGIKNITRLKNISQNRNNVLNEEIAKLLKNEINNHSENNKPYFDLLIVDEAHYFRNKDGDSLRKQTAEVIFGNPTSTDYKPLAKKVLLMTATPNHSSSKDIEKIVSYFTKKFNQVEHGKILETICVRRLRRLSKRSLNKYNYRDERLAESNFNDNPLSEMFFALYQHQLAKQLNEQKENSNGKGVSRMMKYLEGVEFIPFEKNTTEEESENDEESRKISNDYSVGSDASILLSLSQKFKELFNQDPKHPKYDKLVEDLTVNHNGEKAVVFVRRIPSVFEISKRIIEFYDKKLWENMQHDEFGLLEYDKLDRKSFKRFSKLSHSETEDLLEENEGKDEEQKNIPTSKVMNLFKVSKSDAVKSTDASNFRLRFVHSKPGVFSMFFSPGEDYFAAPYHTLNSYRYEVGEKQLENYFNSALIQRIEKISEDNATTQEIKSVLLSKQPLNNNPEKKNVSLPTILTLFWDVFLNDDSLNLVYKNEIKKTYLSFSYYEKESFSSFLEKGVILASEAIVWFYEIYRMCRHSEDDNALDSYIKFCESVKSNLRSKKLYNQIQESILHFRNIYTKVFSINGERNLIEETWDSFNNAQPIYPYNADNSSKKVLSCFNTPFYPDILVATSVLQEGVNLQYFCNTVYHYGMAWTPGDNEQRIGRIDRMFGKIERLLDEENSNATLNIYYPYLKDTIDEEQLRRFIKRKYNEETLIDKGISNETQSDFNFNENDNESWKVFLRKPETTEKEDPFPVDISSFRNGIKTITKSNKQASLDSFYYSIINAIKDITQINTACYFIENTESKKILIDPTLNGLRKQPVVVELNIDHIGTGVMRQTLYCLQMKTPIASFSKYKEFKKRFYESEQIQKLYLPGIKLCLDNSNNAGSNWGIYMSIELPLFISQLKENPISKNEIQSSFMNLICCADQTESEIFNKDLKKEELNLLVLEALENPSIQLRSDKKTENHNNWDRRDGCFILEQKKQLLPNIDNERNSFIFNHEHLFLKSFIKDGQLIHQVSYPTDDAQKIELEVLRKHWEINRF